MPGVIRSRNSTTVTLAPSRAPDRAQLQADVAARRPPPGAPAPRSSSSAPVEETMRCSSIATPGSGARLGAGGDQDVPGARARWPPPAFSSTATRPGPSRRAGALDRGHLVLAEQELDALGQLLDHLVLAGPASRRGRARPSATLMPCAFEAVARLGEQLGGMQQRLGRDAADVQAGAAERRRASRRRPTFMPSWAARIAAT